MIRLSHDDARQLVDLLRSAPGAPFEHIAVTLREQLESPNHCNDLVDTVAAVLMDGKYRASHLDLLRRAILSPRELTTFKATLKKNRTCARCSQELLDYESVTMVSGDVHCYRCAYPEYVRCATCHEAVPVEGIQRTIQRHLQRHTCSPRPADQPSGPTDGSDESEVFLVADPGQLWSFPVVSNSLDGPTTQRDGEDGPSD